MSFSIIPTSQNVLVLFLILGCTVTVFAPSIPQAFTHSRLLSNLTETSKEVLIKHLADISHAPATTPLRVVHEMHNGRVAHAFLEIMQSHRTVNASNIESWLGHLDTFLDRYARGVCPVHYGDLLLTLNQTAYSALPMMRRAVIARVVTAWLTELKGSMPDRAQRALAEVVRKFYHIHTASVVQKGVMEYFHISKAGGTSWNAAAKLNGCNSARSAGSHVKGFGDECRWMDQDVYRNLTGGRKILWGRWGRVSRATPYHGCQSRYEYVVAKGFNYISNEYTLQAMTRFWDAHICPQFINVVTLRNPVKRMESNIRFIMMHVKAAYRRRQQEAEFDSLFCNASAAFWERLAPPVTDNYIVRSFLGEEGFHTPLGHLREEHLAAARDQLLQFDLVMDLEAGEGPSDRLVQQGLGWARALSAAHALDSSVLSVKMQLNYSTCHVEEADMAMLRSRQEPDVRLYSFGRVLNQLDELWLDLTRELGLKPEQGTSEQCGMLYRGANNSALADAMARVVGRLQPGVIQGGGGAGPSGAGPSGKPRPEEVLDGEEPDHDQDGPTE